MDECQNVIDESFLELEKQCSESSTIMVNCIIFLSAASFSPVYGYCSHQRSSNVANRSISEVSSICLAALNHTFYVA